MGVIQTSYDTWDDPPSRLIRHPGIHRLLIEIDPTGPGCWHTVGLSLPRTEERILPRNDEKKVSLFWVLPVIGHNCCFLFAVCFLFFPVKTIVGDFLLGIFLCSKDLWSCFGVINRQVCRYVDQIDILEHGRWSSLPMFQVYPTFFLEHPQRLLGRVGCWWSRVVINWLYFHHTSSSSTELSGDTP